MVDNADGQLKVLVALEPEPGADADEAERLGRQVRSQLRELDIDEITAVAGELPPAGAKGAEAAALLEWLITISGSGGVLVTVVATMRDWLARRGGRERIVLTIGDDTLELDAATAAERLELINTFVRRHQAP